MTRPPGGPERKEKSSCPSGMFAVIPLSIELIRELVCLIGMGLADKGVPQQHMH